MPYDPKTIEPKWQAYWEAHATFRAEIDHAKPEILCARHVPLPLGRRPACRASGGLHRHRHPLPRAANAGLERAAPDGLGQLRPARRALRHAHRHPPRRSRRSENIATFKGQIRRLGFSYDWSRELATTDPAYVRWTQWIFLKLYERGLAYQAEIAVQLVPRPEHRARQRGGQGRPLRRDRRPRGAPPHAPVDAAHHRLRRPPRRRPRGAGLAGKRQGHAAQLDRPLRGGGGHVPRRGPRRGAHRLHHAPGHAVRRHLLRPRPRASAARPHRGRGRARRGRGLRARRGRTGRGGARRSRPRQDRRLHRRLCREPRQRRPPAGLGGRLRARRLRHRRHHGGARPRRARPRIRPAPSTSPSSR